MDEERFSFDWQELLKVAIAGAVLALMMTYAFKPVVAKTTGIKIDPRY